ncbi:MAG: DUF6431 domain-containing protein [Lachnospiraceae bacterium]
MINDFANDFNIMYNDNKKYSEKYREYVDSLDLSRCSCPWCKAIGRFKRETIYERYFINSTDEINNPDILCIHVFRCDSCGHFHAVLPAFICPFSSYSYPFIIEALNEYYHGEYKGNCSRVSTVMGISRQTLSKWIRKFEGSRMEIRMITAGKQHSAITVEQVLSGIRRKRELFLFLADFLRLQLHMFFTGQNWFGTRIRYGYLMSQSNKAYI